MDYSKRLGECAPTHNTGRLLATPRTHIPSYRRRVQVAHWGNYSRTIHPRASRIRHALAISCVDLTVLRALLRNRTSPYPPNLTRPAKLDDRYTPYVVLPHKPFFRYWYHLGTVFALYARKAYIVSTVGVEPT